MTARGLWLAVFGGYFMFLAYLYARDLFDLGAWVVARL